MTDKPFKFEEVWPRTPDRDDALAQLVGDLWKIQLCRLYLSTGRSMPTEAKKLGCFFGFCDEHGNKVTDVKVEISGKTLKVESSATHVGWTVGTKQRVEDESVRDDKEHSE